MKNLLIAIALGLTTQLFAQTHEIIKHNGEKLNVNYIKIECNLVYYSLPNSMEEQKISRYAVAQLTEKQNNSSRIISNKIELTEKSGYKKVIVLQDSESIGLKKTGDLNLFLGKTKGQTKQSLAAMGEKRLKENAALKGNPFIVITSNKTDDLKAVAYTY